MRTILQTPFAEIAGRPGIGETRLEKLFAVIDRAATAIGWDGAGSFPTADQANGDSFLSRFGFPFHVVRNAYYLGAAKTPYSELTDDDWESMARLIQHHFLEDYVLGRFAGALHELHPSLWQERICTFTQRRFSELTWQKGFGHLRQTQVVDLIENLAWLLSTLPAHSDIRVAVLPANIAEANRWIAQLQFHGHEQLPSVHSIREHFLEPLLARLTRVRNACVALSMPHRKHDTCGGYHGEPADECGVGVLSKGAPQTACPYTQPQAYSTCRRVVRSGGSPEFSLTLYTSLHPHALSLSLSAISSLPFSRKVTASGSN